MPGEEAPQFEESPNEEVHHLFYTMRLPIELGQSANVELVFEADGDVSRKIDGVVIGAWARI